MKNKLKVALNIGHGGIGNHYDPGAIGADGTHEHVFNRDELAPLLIAELERRGFEVITIIQEKSFGELPRRINAMNPDVILSLHFNAYDSTATGTETLYFSFSKKSKALANAIQMNMVDALGLANRGIKGRIVGRGSALLRKTKAPCVILEPFFGDRAPDLARARERLGELARGIADGVAAWVSPNSPLF